MPAGVGIVATARIRRLLDSRRMRIINNRKTVRFVDTNLIVIVIFLTKPTVGVECNSAVRPWFKGQTYCTKVHKLGEDGQISMRFAVPSESRPSSSDFWANHWMTNPLALLRPLRMQQKNAGICHVFPGLVWRVGLDRR
jgi:hypothetical protein